MVINLLPPKFKQERKIRKLVKTVSVFLLTIFIILLILTGGILAANYFAKEDLKKIDAKIAEQEKILFRYKETEDEIKTVNTKLGKIESANNNRVFWSILLIELSKLTPSQVQIKTLAMDQKNKKATLTGFAETRNDIARFKEKMSSSKYYKNVTFSSSVHNEEQGNFSFNISAEIGEIK